MSETPKRMNDMPELKLMRSHWLVETGAVDGGGIGHWCHTNESIEVCSKAEAEALKAEWLASGKLITTHWGEVRPDTPYGLFRIRQEWRQIPVNNLVPRAEVEAAIKRALEAAAEVSSPWGSCGCSQDIRALDPAQFIEEKQNE